MKRVDKEHPFDGRTFLTEAEWMTYRRRNPVRYIPKPTADCCVACGKLGTESNPLQNAHRIPFTKGVVDLALTPEFLDRDHNIVTAHRKGCNQGMELDLDGSIRMLQELGVAVLPWFLPSRTHEKWSQWKTSHSDGIGKLESSH
ncbi:MAG: hypothetical protein HY681_09105 [Chloroflexi bacterium]|nr:hypothetical protein [Chloroflexota bacterium]